MGRAAQGGAAPPGARPDTPHQIRAGHMACFRRGCGGLLSGCHASARICPAGGRGAPSVTPGLPSSCPALSVFGCVLCGRGVGGVWGGSRHQGGRVFGVAGGRHGSSSGDDEIRVHRFSHLWGLGSARGARGSLHPFDGSFGRAWCTSGHGRPVALPPGRPPANPPAGRPIARHLGGPGLRPTLPGRYFHVPRPCRAYPRGPSIYAYPHGLGLASHSRGAHRFPSRHGMGPPQGHPGGWRERSATISVWPCGSRLPRQSRGSGPGPHRAGRVS